MVNQHNEKIAQSKWTPAEQQQVDALYENFNNEIKGLSAQVSHLAEKQQKMLNLDMPTAGKWMDIVNMFFNEVRNNGVEDDSVIPNIHYLEKKLPANIEVYRESVEYFKGLNDVIQSSPTRGGDRTSIKRDIIEKIIPSVSAETDSAKKIALIVQWFATLFEDYVKSPAQKWVKDNTAAAVTKTLEQDKE